MNINLQKVFQYKPDKNNLFVKIFKMLSVKVETRTEDPIFDEDMDILKNIESARKEWLNATVNFEHISENDIIDYYTYNIKACQIRYEYLLKKAKEKGLKVSRLSTQESIANNNVIS